MPVGNILQEAEGTWVTEVVARHFPLIHGSFMPLLGRKKEVAGASDRRKYRRGVPVITPMSFTYKGSDGGEAATQHD